MMEGMNDFTYFCEVMCSTPTFVNDLKSSHLVVGSKYLLDLEELVILGVVFVHISAGCPWKEPLGTSCINPESWSLRINIPVVNVSAVQGMVGPDGGEHALINTQANLLFVFAINVPANRCPGQL